MIIFEIVRDMIRKRKKVKSGSVKSPENKKHIAQSAMDDAASNNGDNMARGQDNNKPNAEIPVNSDDLFKFVARGMIELKSDNAQKNKMNFCQNCFMWKFRKWREG